MLIRAASAGKESPVTVVLGQVCDAKESRVIRWKCCFLKVVLKSASFVVNTDALYVGCTVLTDTISIRVFTSAPTASLQMNLLLRKDFLNHHVGQWVPVLFVSLNTAVIYAYPTQKVHEHHTLKTCVRSVNEESSYLMKQRKKNEEGTGMTSNVARLTVRTNNRVTLSKLKSVISSKDAELQNKEVELDSVRSNLHGTTLALIEKETYI